MTARAARGSLSGAWLARNDRRPNLRGAITVERDLPAGTRLWLSGWTKAARGAEFISLSAEIATNGGRRRRIDDAEPDGRFRDADT